jgi:hypothetical protein
MRWGHRLAAPATVAALLAALSVYAPLVNSKARPPRTLFLQRPADRPEPTISLSARPEGDGAWLLEIHTTEFRFTMLCLVEAEASPVGHAHVTRGEQKIASAYVPVVSLGRLAPGSHSFRVQLRGQDHRALVGRNGLIDAELTIHVPRGAGAEWTAHLLR